MHPKVIGLVGPASAGKTTCARYLVQSYDYRRYPFAKTLKEMLRAFGLNEEELAGSLKEVPQSHFCNRSPRYLMQTLGTEWGRNLVGEDVWVKAWLRNTQWRKVVTDDVRFENEAKAIKLRDGILIRVTRPGFDSPAPEHASEANALTMDVDYEIENYGTILDLMRQIDAVMVECGNGKSPFVRAQALPFGNAADIE